MRQAICSPSRADNSWTCTHHLNGGLTRARQVLTWADGALHKPAGADGFVVGLPVTLNGTLTRRNTDSQQGRRCRNFAENLHALAKRQGLPVYLYTTGQSQQMNLYCVNADEVFTSLAAASSLGMDRKSRLQQTGKLDAAAAAALLRSYYADPSQAVLVELKRKWHSERPQR
eukprot:jgi/Astpho2/3424/Aster-x1148